MIRIYNVISLNNPPHAALRLTAWQKQHMRIASSQTPVWLTCGRLDCFQFAQPQLTFSQNSVAAEDTPFSRMRFKVRFSAAENRGKRKYTAKTAKEP